ncbi:MAG: hypothetical protein ACPLRA_03620, partial [Candidatus Saccharicenans sp.]
LAQDKPSVKPEEIVGTWDILIEAEGLVINLSFKLELENNVLSGKMTDQSGTFAEVPVSDLKLEDSTLSFNLTVAAPPDGLVRTWGWEIKIEADKMEGLVYNNELAISVPVSGRKTG